MAGSGKTAALFCLCLLLGGCGVSGRLSWLDEQAGRLLGAITGTSTPFAGSDKVASPSSLSPRDIADKVRSLAPADKERIESWLVEQGFNRYGDQVNAWYASGTPLFTASGTPIERFEYILSKHPEVIELIRAQ